MATLHPMGKFLTIKAIVFFSFWWAPFLGAEGSDNCL